MPVMHRDRSRGHSYSRRLAIVLVLVANLALSVGGVSISSADPGSSSGGGDWARYVESPTTRTVTPVAVASASGHVTNPTGLTDPSGDALTTLTMPPGGPAPLLVLDYGKEVGGFATFDVAATSGAPTLRVGYSETLANVSSTGDMLNYNSPTAQRFDSLVVAAPGQLTSQTIQGGERYELLTLLTPGSVTLRGVSIHFTGYLGTPDALRGYFLSSDDLLNRIWYAGVYTLNLDQVLPGTSPEPYAHDADLRLLIDGAKRDRSVWSGDVAAAERSVFVALDPGYVRDSLQLLGSYPATSADYLVPAVGVQALPGPMPGVCQPYTDTPACLSYSVSYATVFVPALADYYLYTGDLAFVRQEWPNVTRLLAWDAQQVDANGLVGTDSNDGRDWHGGGPALSGEVAWTNEIYYLALRDAGELATALGDPAGAAAYVQAAVAVRTAVNARLWNPVVGVYEVSDSISGVVAQDANSFAIVSGLASPQQASRIVTTLNTSLATDRGMLGYSKPVPAGLSQTISPYMGGYQVDADFETGLDQSAVDLIRREWGWQIDHDPGGTVWEDIPETGDLPGGSSAAHAWGSGPTAALSEYVLGVTPADPGFSTVSVAPQAADLSWAEGSVPTPHGPVTIRWDHQNCAFSLVLTTPSGVAAAVTVPGTSGVSTAMVDGHRTTRTNPNGDFQVNLSSGTHRLSANQSGCA